MLIDKAYLPLVEVDFMNETHLEDVDLINTIYENIEDYEKDASQEGFENLKTAYLAWVNHTVKHFKTEEDEMIKCGFFAYDCHQSEHNRNLIEIRNVWEDFEQDKDIIKLKNYIKNDLPAWLNNHILTMDTVTARFFKNGSGFCLSKK